jgi:hypothetical protein
VVVTSLLMLSILCFREMPGFGTNLATHFPLSMSFNAEYFSFLAFFCTRYNLFPVVFSQAVEAGFEVIDPEETGLGGEGMKSAAQKRKEKKERQKQKEEKKPEPPASTNALASVEAPTAVAAEAKTGGTEVVIVG